MAPHLATAHSPRGTSPAKCPGHSACLPTNRMLHPPRPVNPHGCSVHACGLNGPLRSPGPGAWLSGDASSPADARAAPLHVRVVNRFNDAWRSPRTPVCGCRMAPKRRSVWQSRQLEDARRQRLRYDVTLPLCRLGCTRSRRVFATLPLCLFAALTLCPFASSGDCPALPSPDARPLFACASLTLALHRVRRRQPGIKKN